MTNSSLDSSGRMRAIVFTILLLWIFGVAESQARGPILVVHPDPPETQKTADLRTDIWNTPMEIPIDPEKEQSLYISVYNPNSEPSCIKGADFLLTGWALSDSNLQVTDVELLQEPGFLYSLFPITHAAWGREIEIGPRGFAGILKISFICTSSFDAGNIQILDLEHRSKSMTLRGCRDERWIQSTASSALLKNSAIYGKGERFYVGPGATGMSYAPFGILPHISEVMAGVGTVIHMDSPIPLADGISTLAHYELRIDEAWYGPLTETLELFSNAVVDPGITYGISKSLGSTENGVDYLIPGQQIVFVTARRTEKIARVRNLDTTRSWYLRHVRFLSAPLSDRSQILNVQTAASYDAPFQIRTPMKVDPKYMSHEVSPGKFTLEEFRKAIAENYGEGR